MGGRPVGLTYGGHLDADSDEVAWRQIEEHLEWLFPSLRDIKVTHRWGGPFSVTMDLTPALGYLGDKDAAYSIGCIGQGVSASHLNGQIIRDLVLERQSDLVACPLANRRVVPWPPEPRRMTAAVGIHAYLRAEDAWYERNV